ncbi:MAG: NYN domain-containing protein [Planctomycetes bacterium]|nr:NYN domain-containing protein [Planctomycetota bacterium]
MTHSAETKNLAVFCDFENVALGVRDADYAKFDIAKVLERLLLKGNIVVKKAYSDWARYKEFKASMHEASFELIEIPHVRLSGKNSADIRMVVDALDLCYTKAHVDTFVIISGDSDFSPLVSKLRENNKTVIGVGVKNSTSDLLIANCDEFISYDDLVKPSRPRRKPRVAPAPPTPPPSQANGRKPASKTKAKIKAKPAPFVDPKKQEAWDLIVETYEALLEERGEEGRIWGSMLKQTLKRRKPGFSESHYGFSSFGQLLEEAGAEGILDLIRDEKSGGFIVSGCHAP